MNELKTKFRWVAVLPGAIVFGFLALISVLILTNIYYSLFNVDFNPYASSFGLQLGFFVFAVIYPVTAYFIAPGYKLRTSVILSIIFLIVVFIFGLISISIYTIEFLIFILQTVFGVSLGLFISKKFDERY